MSRVKVTRQALMARDLNTRDVPPLERRAMVKPGSIDEAKRTVEVVWTTGAKVLRGFFEKFWEELSLEPGHVRMERLNNGAPLLNAHDGYDARAVLGVVESARLGKGEATATVRFARAEDDPAADQVFRKVKDGILQNVSVGYRTYKFEKVEGGDAEIPTYRAVDWEPYEISVVPVGADDGAGFRGADNQRPTNPCSFMTQETRTMAAKTQQTEQTTTTGGTGAVVPPENAIEEATRAAKAARLKEAEVTAAAAANAAQEATQKERTRQLDIRKLVRLTKLGDELADKFIEQGATVEDVRTAVLNLIADADQTTPTVSHVRVGTGDDERDKLLRGGVAWLVESAGLSDLFAEARQKFPEKFKDVAVDPGEFRGLKLYELARRTLERRGVRTSGMSQLDMVGLAFTHRSGYQSTSDFAVLLETTMNKVLLAAYALQADTWSLFCRAETMSDFRAAGRYRSGAFSVLDVVNEAGEFKNKVVPDGVKIPLALQTYGNIVGLSRQTIVNDDLGSLTDMATKLGRAAKLTIENAVYALITANGGLGPTQGDSQPFFHSNRANVNATASALDAAGIDADRVVMGLQKDPNSNEFIDLRPAILLVSSAKGATARVLNGAPYDPLSNVFQKPNPVAGLFRTVVDSPRLTGTRRYILADPAIAPIIVVTFLEGQGQAPVVDSANGWRTDGVEWKVRLDAKAQMFDPKGGVTNAGT